MLYRVVRLFLMRVLNSVRVFLMRLLVRLPEGLLHSVSFAFFILKQKVHLFSKGSKNLEFFCLLLQNGDISPI